jgi:hypothetical protein
MGLENGNVQKQSFCNGSLHKGKSFICAGYRKCSYALAFPSKNVVTYYIYKYVLTRRRAYEKQS